MVKLPSISTEYVRVPVETSQDLTDTLVYLAFMAVGEEPVEADWITALWTEPLVAASLVGPDGGTVLAEGTYDVWVRFIDSVETPARFAGKLRIT